MSELSLTPRNKATIIKIMKALASETRWRILTLLAQQEYDISRLAEAVDHTEANVSAQVKHLEKAGLVECRYEPGEHGVRKVCKTKYKTLIFYIVDKMAET